VAENRGEQAPQLRKRLAQRVDTYRLGELDLDGQVIGGCGRVLHEPTVRFSPEPEGGRSGDDAIVSVRSNAPIAGSVRGPVFSGVLSGIHLAAG
jgi:hypothetical protein